MKDKIRFLATGDIHSDKKFLRNIEKYTNFNNIDYILFTGDLSDKKNDFKKILSTFKDKPILMVHGNHETKKQLKILESKYNVHLLSKQEKQIHKDLIIFGPKDINLGSVGKNEENILEELIKRYEKIKNIKTKIFLSHIPADNTLIGDSSPYFPIIGGSEAIRVFLDNFKLDLTLVGHIHETSGLEEKVNENKILNVGRTSKIIEFDTKTLEIKILN